MDKYTIYQLKDDPIYRNVIFESYDFVQDQGFVPNISDYNEVYSGDLSSFSGTRGDYLLENIYEKFNIDHPADFTGHSLSMSDVVVLHYDEAIENKNDFVYYVDRFGFTELPETFLEHSTPTQEIETIQSLSDRRDELMAQITAAQDFYNLRLNEDFAVDGNIDELANFRNQVTEDIRNMENELSGVNERLNALLDAQEQEYIRQQEGIQDPSMNRLGSLEYYDVETFIVKDGELAFDVPMTDEERMALSITGDGAPWVNVRYSEQNGWTATLRGDGIPFGDEVEMVLSDTEVEKLNALLNNVILKEYNMSLEEILSYEIIDGSPYLTKPEDIPLSPEEIAERYDPIYQLAYDVDNFMHDWDLYDYYDSLIDSREANIELIRTDIEKGNVDYMRSTLKDILSNSDISENEYLLAYNLDLRLAHYDSAARKTAFELMNKFGYELVSESEDKVVIKYKDADLPFNPMFDSWVQLINDLGLVEDFANSHTLNELIDIRDSQTDLKYGYVYRKPTDNGFKEINLSYNQVSDAARYKTGFEINATKQSDRKVFLTGLPVSEKMKSIISDLERGDSVPIDDIQSTAEIQTAFTCISHATPTHMIIGRDEIQNKIFNEMVNLGSAVVDDSTNVQYNGDIKNNRRLDIVIGLPGSGKSSALVDVISAETKALVIDNDNIKKLIPEFNNGWGGDIVHEESKLIERRVFMNSLKAGKNVVIPKVGGSTRDMVDNYIIPAVAIGYSVNVHYVELSREKALSRMLNRFIDTGKYQNPAIIDKYVNEKQGNLIEQTFIHLKDSGLMTGISHWDNDVKLGERPILIHSEGLDDNFIKEARTYDKIYDSLVNDQKGEEYGSYSKAAETDAKDFNSDAERDKEQLHKSGDSGLLRRSGEESLPGGKQESDVHPVDERRGVQRASEKTLGRETNGSDVGVTESLQNKLNDFINKANSNSSDRNRNIDLSKYRDELA